MSENPLKIGHPCTLLVRPKLAYKKGGEENKYYAAADSYRNDERRTLQQQKSLQQQQQNLQQQQAMQANFAMYQNYGVRQNQFMNQNQFQSQNQMYQNMMNNQMMQQPIQQAVQQAAVDIPNLPNRNLIGQEPQRPMTPVKSPIQEKSLLDSAPAGPMYSYWLTTLDTDCIIQ